MPCTACQDSTCCSLLTVYIDVHTDEVRCLALHCSRRLCILVFNSWRFYCTWCIFVDDEHSKPQCHYTDSSVVLLSCWNTSGWIGYDACQSSLLLLR